MTMQTGGLPGEYRAVEYIEGTGTQYIDTGIIPILQDEIRIVFYSDATGDNIRPFGSYYPGVAVDGYKGLRIVTNDFHQTTGTIGGGRKSDLSCTADGRWICDGDTVATGYPVQTMQKNITLSIFKAHYTNGTLFGNGQMRLYAFEYKRGGALLMNLVPCIRKSDDKPGAYDTASKTFYANAGTGEFTVPN